MTPHGHCPWYDYRSDWGGGTRHRPPFERDIIMAFEPTIILDHARLAADPETRQTKSGRRYLDLRVVQSERTRDRNGSWQDGTAYFFSVAIYDGTQANFYRNLHKGQLVCVSGGLSERVAQGKDGQPTVYRDIRRANISVLPTPRQRQNNGGNNGGGFGSAPQQGGFGGYAGFGGDDSPSF